MDAMRRVVPLVLLAAAAVVAGSAPVGAANGAQLAITAMSAPTHTLLQSHPVVVTVSGANIDAGNVAIEPKPAAAITVLAANCLTPRGGARSASTASRASPTRATTPRISSPSRPRRARRCARPSSRSVPSTSTMASPASAGRSPSPSAEVRGGIWGMAPTNEPIAGCRCRTARADRGRSGEPQAADTGPVLLVVEPIGQRIPVSHVTSVWVKDPAVTSTGAEHFPLGPVKSTTRS